MASTLTIQSNESKLCGKWISEDGKLVADVTTKRIFHLVENELVEVARSEDGWSVLYLDKKDGRYWELNYPDSDQHGGGPPCLEFLSRDAALAKFKLSAN
ncbi:Immunity protein 27 [Dyella sp. OK004]|uniref:Imm27 family immunity protein n=1 Tax=Dyella sp. OK004 TaxID=1855292 RepID=UPI0008E334CB|nr:Imm27 family immunity protein [Dyella sp. OK004]SFS08524.1 Immunity protein 27 [Dyella sp. OK004]